MAQEVGSAERKGIVAAGVTDKGRTRDHNEDSFLVRSDLHLYVVADGAGGHNAGEIASALLVKSIENYFEATELDARKQPEIDRFGLMTQARRVGAAVQKANSDVMEIARASRERHGMGSTVVVAYLRPEWRRLYLAHVGDSRCYRLRRGELEQLTHDHTMLNDVLELRPGVDDAVLARLPTTVVTRAIGMGDKVRVELRSHTIARGDRYLLCSDGLWGDLEEDAVRGALMSPEGPRDIGRQLVRLANEAGGGDNITAIVIDIERDGDQDYPYSDIVKTGVLIRGDVPRPSESSAPEILLLGIESDADIDPTGNVRPVPADRFDEGLREAVEDFVAPLRTAKPESKSPAPKVKVSDPKPKSAESEPPAPVRTPTQRPTQAEPDVSMPQKCGTCGRKIPAGARFCPFCGEARAK